MCDTARTAAAARYAQDVVSLHRELSFGRLLRQVDPRDLAHLAVRGDGLVTVGVQTRHLPHRYLLGLAGFRLAQYLQLGWACESVVHGSAMFGEPAQGVHADDVHVITMSGSGQILGYVSLASCGAAEPAPLLDRDRARYPVEVAHDINVFDHVAPLAGVQTDQVRELKRFVHSRSLVDRTQRLRVSLELLAGAGRVLSHLDPPVRTLVGDVEEKVALRHLILAGLDVQLVEGTQPRLPERDLMHLAYVKRGPVKPFVAHVPDPDEVVRRVDLLEQTLASPDLFQATSQLTDAMPGTLQRVAA